jgi:prephenate dehydrogenase
VADLLERGNAGHARIPGKHGAPPARYAVVPVVIPDRPGALAALFADAGEADANIEDVAIEHSPGQPVGLVELSVKPAVADRLVSELRRRGWTVQG